MKVWLNDLKEGDIFYFPSTILCSVLQCKHLGDAHNMNYKMSRIKFEILEGCNDEIKKALGNINELFVNQYVYTDYYSANEALIDQLKKELKTVESSILDYKNSINNLEVIATELRKALSI